MQCNENCKHWYKNIPSDYIAESIKNEIVVEPGTYGFCEVLDDVRFTIESCEASDESKKNAQPLLKSGSLEHYIVYVESRIDVNDDWELLTLEQFRESLKADGE